MNNIKGALLGTMEDAKMNKSVLALMRTLEAHILRYRFRLNFPPKQKPWYLSSHPQGLVM